MDAKQIFFFYVYLASQFQSQGVISTTRLFSKQTQLATCVYPPVSESMIPAQSLAAPEGEYQISLSRHVYISVFSKPAVTAA